MGKQIPERATWFQLTEAASVGIEMALAIVIGTWGGQWLEEHVTHWAPWTSRLGIAAGIGAAILAVVRTAVNFKKRLDAEEKQESESKLTKE